MDELKIWIGVVSDAWNDATALGKCLFLIFSPLLAVFIWTFVFMESFDRLLSKSAVAESRRRHALEK